MRVLCGSRCLDNPSSSYRHHNVVECYFTEILPLQQAIDCQKELKNASELVVACPTFKKFGWIKPDLRTPEEEWPTNQKPVSMCAAKQ